MDIYEILKNQKGIIAITGAAGSGKTTLCNKLYQTFNSCAKYSADFAFIGDSQYRKNLLDQKQKYSIDHLIDACNQFNWWNWEQVENVINTFIVDGSLSSSEVYNRDTGKMELNDALEKKDLLIYEGAILGPDVILNKINKIFFLTCSPEIRLQRLLNKDIDRRNIQEIAARFLITEYSETIYYKYLFEHYNSKITIINEDGNILPFLNDKIFNKSNFYLPIKINI